VACCKATRQALFKLDNRLDQAALGDTILKTVLTMEPQVEAAQLDREIEEAQRDLRDMLAQVNHKVERVEARLISAGDYPQPYTRGFLRGRLARLFHRSKRPYP
jgi:hypothetical protein